MKNLAVIFFLLVTFGSCNDDLTKGAEKELIFESATGLKSGSIYTNSDFSVQLDSVTSDSRCPSDVICVWAGNASVNFTATIGREKYAITLNTNSAQSFPSDTTLQHYFIQLINLMPYPVSTSTIDQEDYEATIVVKKLKD